MRIKKLAYKRRTTVSSNAGKGHTDSRACPNICSTGGITNRTPQTHAATADLITGFHFAEVQFAGIHANVWMKPE